ncbi:ATP-dependent helicase [Weizmannia acidilactici]|uniref:ATP-dependent helicase n=1 Tax=Weizmannia acidilactici TaxID=2607726 RepID=UPI00124C4684|nr:ATP-dependent helicase [Weizmannia acidilactici]GER73812.1 DNA helicase [Weizmannia acidilactici]
MNTKQDFFTRKKEELAVVLNDVQLAAVRHTEGPLLLLASPGSGKTTTVIMRIAYLIEEKGVAPSRIKAITFSRAAANDMKDRFRKFFPYLQPVDFSTIHSLAFELVRAYFRKVNMPFRLIEGDADMQFHKKTILRNLYKSTSGVNITEDQLEELMTYISYIKNKMVPSEKWASVATEVPGAERILMQYEAFKRTGTGQLLLDFDDMLTKANEILQKDADLRRMYQERYDYVLTDESQDTSMVQHVIVEKLVQVHQNLCVVADDDQSIYSWRGAESAYLLNFKKVYPDAKILYMEQNYRSSQEIVTAANQFIKRNKHRYDKNMFTENPAAGPIRFVRLPDYKYQAKYLAQNIGLLENFFETAVLYRNNTSSIALINEFDRAGIPFYMKDADNRFFSHWVVQDILNMMRLTFTDKRADILEQVHSKLNGYITKQQLEAVKRIRNNKSVFDNLIQYAPLKAYQKKQILEVKETLRQMNGMPPLDAIKVIRGRLGYEKALENLCKKFGFRKDYLIGILNTLEEIADTLSTMEEFAARLKHLEQVLKMAKLKKGKNAVTLSTFHNSKGLEFENVYMIDLVEGIIPGSDEKEDELLMEESVRLFYVAMTRAKKSLEMVSYEKRNGNQMMDSRFVSAIKKIVSGRKKTTRTGSVERKVKMVGLGKDTAEIPYNPNAIKDVSAFTVGKKVKHRVFGHGEILSVDGDTLEIRFEKRVVKLSAVTCLKMGLLEEVDKL